jgi:hypothetical protein
MLSFVMIPLFMEIVVLLFVQIITVNIVPNAEKLEVFVLNVLVLIMGIIAMGIVVSALKGNVI